MNDLEALQLFNEKAVLLRDSAFLEQSEDAQVTISFGADRPMTVDRRGPDDASIREFVVTLRFFIQDNEKCSIRNIEKLYEQLAVSDERKDEVRRCRAAINSFLDRQCLIKLQSDSVSYRRIMEVFVYGSIAHANQEKANVLKSWKQHPSLCQLFYNEFVITVLEVTRAIGYIWKLNGETLQELAHEIPVKTFPRPLP